jgi:glycosyltransferase involved in cell wall biosynthesis
MKKVLIITYYWPPSGGAGVQRWLKFSKYLPQYGWQPVILTVDPEYAAYPALDISLEKEIAEGIEIFRTRATDWFSIYSKDKSKVPSAGFARNMDNSFRGKISRFIRGNFFIPDPRRGWNKFAFRKASEIIQKGNIEHIITTSPPHSTQLIGLRLKKSSPGIKWIADLRDPWTDIYYYDRFYPSFFAKMLDVSYEKRVIKSADVIITVGQSLKDSFISRFKGIENKIKVITNGYDNSDFEGKTVSAPGKLIISYMGTLSESYPVNGLITAMKNLYNEKIDFTLRFAGEIPDTIKEMILSEIPGSLVEFNPYLNHDDAVKFILGSSVLMLIIPDHRSNKSIVTGKLFEYIAAARPILCIGPSDGDASVIIEKTGAGKTFGYFDGAGTTEFLKNINKFTVNSDRSRTIKYSRMNLTGEVVQILNDLF